MMQITGLSHLFKWENLHNWWLTKYFFAPLYSLTASRCSTEAHLAGVPFPRSFDLRLVPRQSCSARLKSLVLFGCKKKYTGSAS